MNPTPASPLINDLRQHLEVCRELSTIVEREAQALRRSDAGLNVEFFLKKNLLPSLNQSLNRIRQHRVNRAENGSRLSGSEMELAPLLREIQDLIMKIIVVDRENEQALLRKGLVPARHLPHANRQRPHFVADLYRRQTEDPSRPGSDSLLSPGWDPSSGDRAGSMAPR
jgi:flagellar biosynthesis/type III secretory pathway chaperone